MDDVAERADVVIIGAGPAGLATAIELADRGVAAIVAERRPDSSDHPRATALTEGTMETLRRWGVEGDVRRAGFPSEHAMSIRPSLIGREVFRAPMDDHVWTCAQDRLQPILADRAQEAGARIRYGCELRSTKSSEGGVEVNVSGAGGRSRRTIRAQYVVGADGAHSAVREQSGMLMTRVQEFGSWISILFHASLREYTGGSPFMVYGIGDPSTGGVLSPTDDNDRWIRGVNWYPERGERLEDYDDARCVELIRSAVGVDHLPVTIDEVRAFQMAAGIVDRYVVGSTVVAGDAAHVVTPATGMGLNLALDDGISLGVHLAEALDGNEGFKALDLYERERRPVAESVLGSELAAAAS